MPPLEARLAAPPGGPPASPPEGRHGALRSPCDPCLYRDPGGGGGCGPTLRNGETEAKCGK